MLNHKMGKLRRFDCAALSANRALLAGAAVLFFKWAPHLGVVRYSLISNWGLAPCLRELACAQFGSQWFSRRLISLKLKNHERFRTPAPTLRRACAELARAGLLTNYVILGFRWCKIVDKGLHFEGCMGMYIYPMNSQESVGIPKRKVSRKVSRTRLMWSYIVFTALQNRSRQH